MEIIALIVVIAVLVLGLLAMYSKLRTAQNKGGRVDQLGERVDTTAEIIRSKNVYIKNLEKAVLDSADPERVADVLNGLFADKDGIPADSELLSEQKPRATRDHMGFRLGWRRPPGD